MTKVFLGIIAASLVVIAARPYIAPTAVHAEAAAPDNFWFEPGIYMLRQQNGGQVLGKVGVDLNSGNVYGFPTGTNDPYPASPMDAKPQVSHPIPLGRFALAEAR